MWPSVTYVCPQCGSEEIFECSNRVFMYCADCGYLFPKEEKVEVKEEENKDE